MVTVTIVELVCEEVNMKIGGGRHVYSNRWTQLRKYLTPRLLNTTREPHEARVYRFLYWNFGIEIEEKDRNSLFGRIYRLLEEKWYRFFGYKRVGRPKNFWDNCQKCW